MIFGSPELVLKAKNLELRTPRYSDYEQWRDVREIAKHFWSHGSQKEITIF